MAYTTIKKPSDYFNTKLYTGNGSTQAITGVGFQPDLVWIKDRDATDWHWWNDAIRGATKTIHSNVNSAESTQATSITAFDADGFTLGNDGSVNRNTENFASWNWLASNTTASNTDGTITSTVSANTTSGFSIVSYTGTGSNATVGHGLSSVPKMIIVKDRSAVKNWTVYHVGVGNDKDILLDVTNAENTSTAWNNTTPTSSVFSIGTLGNVNTSSNNYIAYCFAEKKGFSKFGLYTGNGNADGPFIYTGFKPAFYMTKRTDTTSNWHMYDAKRDIDNSVRAELRANTSDAEVDVERVDFLSNGIKTRNTGSAMNTSGGSYIYMAFAEEPLVGDNPATAR